MGDLLGLEYSLNLQLESENEKLRKRIEELEKAVFGTIERNPGCSRDCRNCAGSYCQVPSELLGLAG